MAHASTINSVGWCEGHSGVVDTVVATAEAMVLASMVGVVMDRVVIFGASLSNRANDLDWL